MAGFRQTGKPGTWIEPYEQDWNTLYRQRMNRNREMGRSGLEAPFESIYSGLEALGGFGGNVLSAMVSPAARASKGPLPFVAGKAQQVVSDLQPATQAGVLGAKDFINNPNPVTALRSIGALSGGASPTERGLNTLYSRRLPSPTNRNIPGDVFPMSQQDQVTSPNALSNAPKQKGATKVSNEAPAALPEPKFVGYASGGLLGTPEQPTYSSTDKALMPGNNVGYPMGIGLSDTGPLTPNAIGLTYSPKEQAEVAAMKQAREQELANQPVMTREQAYPQQVAWENQQQEQAGIDNILSRMPELSRGLPRNIFKTVEASQLGQKMRQEGALTSRGHDIEQEKMLRNYAIGLGKQALDEGRLGLEKQEFGLKEKMLPYDQKLIDAKVEKLLKEGKLDEAKLLMAKSNIGLNRGKLIASLLGKNTGGIDPKIALMIETKLQSGEILPEAANKVYQIANDYKQLTALPQTNSLLGDLSDYTTFP